VLEPAVALDAFFAACASHQDASHGSGVSHSVPAEELFLAGFAGPRRVTDGRDNSLHQSIRSDDGRGLKKQNNKPMKATP
jgi:hypothetical protein